MKKICEINFSYGRIRRNSSEFGRNSSIFGRTDLRKGVSEAKFDVEAAGDVKNSKISRKSPENREKPEFFSVFRDFRLILEELGIFGRENQLAHQILLQIHLS